jgi:hypothetical protein
VASHLDHLDKRRDLGGQAFQFPASYVGLRGVRVNASGSGDFKLYAATEVVRSE